VFAEQVLVLAGVDQVSEQVVAGFGAFGRDELAEEGYSGA
jgi:hypothetical protein